MILYRVAVNVVAYMNAESSEAAEAAVVDAIADALDTDECDFAGISPQETKEVEKSGE